LESLAEIVQFHQQRARLPALELRENPISIPARVGSIVDRPVYPIEE
jgi:hypothetical protein